MINRHHVAILAMTAAVRGYGGEVQKVRVRSVEEREGSVFITADVRLRPYADEVQVFIRKVADEC